MEARTVEDVVARTVRVCASQPTDLPFAAVYVDGALRGCTPGAAGLLPERGADLGTGLIAAPVHPTADSWPEQALALPIGEAGSLVLGLNPRQPLDEQYRGFCGLLANQVSAALAATGSYERERQRADALAELDRAKTAFLTNVSHEFRTPLTLVLGPVEDAIAAAEGQPEQVERLESAYRNAQRLLRLVDSLLAFSRVESGQARPEPTPVDLGALTEQIASSFAELCARAGIELVVDCAPVAAEVDVAMWETVVLNLLSNAVKYTVTGSIRVEVAGAEDGWVSVRVADTGIGIAAKDVGRLFERFYRADNTRGRSVEGTGIGLSLVRSLVELHGGAIGVASEVDVGTVVTVRLPATKGTAAAPRST
ncbi:sensor histidine kinase [Actinokineospora soli]|uniref:histidine kinase n=1 Tax=Actinokineospora soli TaxID=1048753 RepID=A0ABW2TSU9_9PSEU